MALGTIAVKHWGPDSFVNALDKQSADEVPLPHHFSDEGDRIYEAGASAAGQNGVSTKLVQNVVMLASPASA